MYIAFRWLFGLASAMWVAMCCIDYYFNGMDGKTTEGLELLFLQNKNLSYKTKQYQIDVEKLNEVQQKDTIFPLYHFIMFFSGSGILLLLHKKQNILLFARKVYYLNTYNNYFEENCLKLYLNKIAKNIGVAILKNTATIWGSIYKITVHNTNKFFKRKYSGFSNSVNHNLTLLKKFKEIYEERRNLGKLLLTTIRENKNMRMRYQLENLAKNRLARYIENTEKLIKENRCQYISFQQLYLATYQENVFLKSRIKKLTNERDNAVRNLIALVNEVCKSKNRELKEFCCRFIVETEGSLLNCDVKGEIRMFLNNSKSNKVTNNKKQSTNSEINKKYTEIIECDSVILSHAPKLRGLPGEYVWTVKDKDGLIEKIYEYNFQTDYDNGDTIRRIRQYSVYYDKDCLLDYKSSKTFIDDSNINQHGYKIKHSINNLITRQRFLTASPAFQEFIKHTGNIVQSSLPVSVMPRV